jgi:regulator of protease activity HflC (stomatin/prohibitin superfamily)
MKLDEFKTDEMKPEGEPAEPKKKKKKKKSKKLEWFMYFLGIALTIVLLWPYCTVVVEAGHTGVYFSKFGGGTIVDKPRGEGLHFKLPWDDIVQYDSRYQSKPYEIVGLTKGGLNVRIDMSVIWYIDKSQAGYLHVTAGPDYAERVIDPAVRSTVRSIIGSYEQSRLYDGDPLELQNDVMVLLNETLSGANFTIHNILIREVILPEPMADAISAKFVAEQGVLAERYRVLESVESYKKSYVDAEAVRISQSVITEGMSEAYLRYLGIQATLALSESANAKLVIIGDKDGLPLILNPDSLEVSMTLPEGLAPDEYIPEGQEGARMDNMMGTFETMQQYLELMDNILGEMIGRFPEASYGIGDSNLPQDSQVPITPR